MMETVLEMRRVWQMGSSSSVGSGKGESRVVGKREEDEWVRKALGCGCRGREEKRLSPQCQAEAGISSVGRP